MGRKGKPPFICHTTGNPYLDFFAAAVVLAIRDVEHPCPARPQDAYSALAFLTGHPLAAGLLRRAGYPLPGLHELNDVLQHLAQTQAPGPGRR